MPDNHINKRLQDTFEISSGVGADLSRLLLYEQALENGELSEFSLESLMLELRKEGPAKHSELIVNIGGTIVSLQSEKGRAPGVEIESLLSQPGDINYWGSWDETTISIQVPSPDSVLSFGEAVDSSNLSTKHFAKIAEICFLTMKYRLAKRIIFPIGSDTAAYAASSVACMIRNPNIPIVFVSSMKGPDEEGSDAINHLQNSRVIASKIEPGVYLYFGRKAYDARRITKKHSIDKDAFESPGAHPVASLVLDMHTSLFGEAFRAHYFTRDDHFRYYNAMSPPESGMWPTKAEALWQDSRIAPSTIDYTGHNIGASWTREKLDNFLQGKHEPFATLKKHGLVRSREEYFSPPKEPELRTAFENAVAYEEITLGYKAEWLEKQITEANMHGIILGRLDRCSKQLEHDIKAVIARHAERTPIVLLENAHRPESQEMQKLIKSLEELGAWPSYGRTKEFSVAALKSSLAQSKEIERQKNEWQQAENIGGIHGAKVRDGKEPTNFQTPDPTPVTHGIRYIALLPGESKARIERELLRDDVKALILGGFGPGNVPCRDENELLSVITKYATRKPIVLITQCRDLEKRQETVTDPNIYETGKRALKAGAIQTGKHHTLNETIIALDRALEDSCPIDKIQEKYLQ